MFAAVRADVAALRSRIPHARATIDHLAARDAREALVDVDVDGNNAEANQLLGFAEQSVGVAERRREAGQREQASLALEASVESVRRAAALLDAVETFEVEVLRAESTLTALVEECRRDLAAARRAPRSRGVADTIGELQAALAALPPAGVNTDPFAHLTRLREARAALDAGITSAGQRATRPIQPMVHVHHAIREGDRQLDIARDAIARHRWRISAEALTRLAESEHIRIDLSHSFGSSAATTTVARPDHRGQLIAMARRVASLARECLHLAQRDIDGVRFRDTGHPRGIISLA